MLKDKIREWKVFEDNHPQSKPDVTVDAVMELVKDGLSKEEISDTLGCGWIVAEGALRRAGISDIEEARKKLLGVSWKPKRTRK